MTMNNTQYSLYNLFMTREMHFINKVMFNKFY